mgnify:CR=1 FL=1
MNSTLAENLKKIRKKHNLSQEDLATILGVSRQAISKWESKVAYPEMDKIIMLCNKFNLNIDDLLHKDINAVTDKEITKKKFDNYLDKIFNSITDGIQLFWQMTWKSKIKFICEEIFIIGILFIIWLLGAYFGSYVFYYLFNNLNYSVYKVIYNVIGSLYIILGFIFNLIIVLKLYKSSYLNCYETVKEDRVALNEEKDSIKLQNQPQIIIKNTSNNDDYFFKIIFNLLKGIIKGISFIVVLMLSFTLVLLSVGLISSFLIVNSGLLYVGLLISIVSLGSLCLLSLIVLLNFIFNRTTNMKIIINIFLISLISTGIGWGLSLVSLLSFKDTLLNLKYMDTRTLEVAMQDNLSISNLDNIEYIETNSDKVKFEYQINKACTLDYANVRGSLRFYSRCSNRKEIINQLINSLNNKEIYNFDDTVYEINNVKVYASLENIEKIKENSK